ncbi:putative polyamine oxidase 4-like protein [Cladobotryum mycophilum]|uniref:Polyamine oxidase 4-like protein n=1 Tax=Cladobotryum mycophilum TaxID=491253 RepID=A0ABR0SJE0_9HYPO
MLSPYGFTPILVDTYTAIPTPPGLRRLLEQLLTYSATAQGKRTWLETARGYHWCWRIRPPLRRPSIATWLSSDNTRGPRQDRGRLHQEKLGNGELVDIGANWIHGTTDNPMLDIAKQTGTAVGVWDSKASIYDESGTLYLNKECDQYTDVMWDIIQDAFRCSDQSSAEINEHKSLFDFFREKVEEKIPDTEPGFQKKRETVLKMSEMWGTFVGSPIAKQSLKFFWLEECIEGENLFCAGTYKKILEVIAKPALDGASIKFNSVAERISYRSDPGDEVKVQLRGGRTLSFDEVVVTTPLGWLQKNLAAFEPPLPARLTKAINSIGYGCLEKVYISFPKAFWLATEEDDTTVQGFIQWIAPTYDPENNPKQWIQEVVELATIAPEAAHPTLLFYIYGEQSEYITSTVAGLDSPESKNKFLLDFFKPYYSRLPHYSESSADCQPAFTLATNWLRDELAGNGSYSNFQIGLEHGDEDVKTMRQGLPDHGLWLAGEHTAAFAVLGTVTGAYWSGESVGRRIAEMYGLPKRKAQDKTRL